MSCVYLCVWSKLHAFMNFMIIIIFVLLHNIIHVFFSVFNIFYECT